MFDFLKNYRLEDERALLIPLEEYYVLNLKEISKYSTIWTCFLEKENDGDIENNLYNNLIKRLL